MAGVSPDATRRWPKLRRLLPAAVLVALGVVLDVFWLDSRTRNSLLVVDGAERQRWGDVLSHAERLPADDIWNVFQVNRALYHRGELLERMFAYPQVSDAVPALTLRFASLTETAQRVPLEHGDILFDLGRINESQHMAYEALELFGERPQTLQRLVLLHAIKGEPDAARRFLAVLDRSLLQRRWARDVLRQLDADPALCNLPAVALGRQRMVDRDLVGRSDLEAMLDQLLEPNRQNRMAFEYQMAYYLLSRRIDKLVARLDRFDDFGDARLPQHCEEALVIYLEGSGAPEAERSRVRIRPETWQRNEAFVRALEQFHGRADAAFVALHADFGDSYFFFFVFGHNNLQLAQARPSS